MWKSNEDSELRRMLGVVESDKDRERESPNSGIMYGKILFRDDDDLNTKFQGNQRVKGKRAVKTEDYKVRSPYKRGRHAYGDSVGSSPSPQNYQGNPSVPQNGGGWSGSFFSGNQPYQNAAGQPNSVSPLAPLQGQPMNGMYSTGGSVSNRGRQIRSNRTRK